MQAKTANAFADLMAPIGMDDSEKDRDKKPKRMDRAPTGLGTDMLQGLGGARGLEPIINQDDT